MKVVWTEQALYRLQEIEDYISRDSPHTAVRWIDRLIARGEDLAAFPASGRKVPELNSSKIREVLVGTYRIVYRLKPQRIEILTVFEGHRQLPASDFKMTEKDFVDIDSW